MKSPSEWADGPRIAGAQRWLTRYFPFLATVAVIALISIILPGRSSNTQTSSDLSGSSASLPQAAAGNPTAGDGAPKSGAVAAAVQRATTQVQQANPNVLTFKQAQARGIKLEANCDLKKGRIKIPSWTAPPCTQALDGANAGKTWQGVTANKVVIAVYVAQSDPATQAILTAAGDGDTPEQNKQQVKEWATLYEATMNTWGRKVELHFVDASGASTDDAAAKADAIKVATQVKAFASWGSPNNTYVNELVARGVMCMCTVELPNSFYTRWAPYVWSTLQSSDHTGVLLQEYLLKRLNNRPAKWAGQTDFTLKKRVFGLLQYETKDYAYHAATERNIKELAKHGIKLKVVYFNGYPDLQANQEQARPDIQAMKQAGVTTIICGCDPFAPIFFTQEATNQAYFPEWFDVGSALTDTTFFGRTYNPQQWAHAFGFGQLGVRLKQELSDSYKLYYWYYHHVPTAKAGYGVIRAPIDLFYRGMHAAGPVLTPKTFQEGMFAQPLLGANMKTVTSVGFGPRLYPVSQWTAFHDMVEIWWDRTAQGKDEVGGANGVGMWRYVKGGQRYLPGQIPSGSPAMFDPNGAVLVYNDYPPGEAPPNYPAIH